MFQPFGFDKALKALQDGQALTGKDGILAYTNRRIPIDAVILPTRGNIVG